MEGIPAERMKKSDLKSDFFSQKPMDKTSYSGPEGQFGSAFAAAEISRNIKYAPEKASIRKTPKNDSELKNSELKHSLLFTPFLSAHNKYPVI